MFKLIKMLLVLLLIYSVPSMVQSQSKKDFYNKANFTAFITVNAIKNRVIDGNSIGIKGSFHLNPNNFGLFVGGEAFASKSGSSFTGDPRVENGNKNVVGGFGFTVGLLLHNTNVINDSRVTFGFSHISQAGNLLLPDLFGYLKLHQIQNDWICYVEGTSEINFNQKMFNRLIGGARYEIPNSSLAQASVNGQEIKIPAATRRNFRAWGEIGLFTFALNNNWTVTPSFRAEYIYFTQNQLNRFQPGFVISICNQTSEVLRIAYSQESAKNTLLLHSVSLSLDVIHFGQGF
jgi:hypothetical protein